ncbi:BNR-4 repeat-containing protein [Jiangella asiatica]|uniref:BNR-4 repeat-containing protein n=1 Tax=Jiangella asiatica TaxID=2530372 RepID=UPI0013A5D111|nr:BNR-4 repeat-containing protein [Jiangella asiatica]
MLPLVTASAAVAPQLAVEPVPFAMDATNQAAWWNPVAEHDGATYFAFDAPADEENLHEVHIAKRTDTGEWTVGCLRAGDGSCVRYNDDIGHHQPSIAVDGRGHIHAFVSMHGHGWRYYRSDEPGSVTTLTNHSAEMPDTDGGVTYPTTTSTPTGDVYLIARVASAETGASPSGRLYRWDVDTSTWTRVAVFAHEPGYAIYPDQLQADRRGQVHILWEWADGSASGIRHLGSYLVYQPEHDRFVGAGGLPVRVPVTTEAPADVVYQPLEGEESKDDGTSSVDPGIQSAKLVLLDPAVRPGAVAYRYRPEPGALFQVRWAQWDGRRWVRETIYSGAMETEAAIGATYHDRVARVYYTFKPPMCDPGSTERGGLFLAEKEVSLRPVRTDAGWTVSLLEDESAILRLATTTRDDGTDVLYLAAPNIDDPPASRLYYATLPRTEDSAEGSADVLASASAAEDETNWAYAADVMVSSALTPQSGGTCLVDGNRTDRNSRWISARGDLTPTATIQLAQPVDVDRVEVYSGYFTDSRAIVRAFTVELLVDGLWQPVASVTDNTRNPVVVDVAGSAPADQVRLVLTDPSGYEGGSDLARVFEVEVYGSRVP